MARYRRRMLAPINTNKHFVPQSAISVSSGTVSNLIIADAVVAPAASNTFDVVEGAVLKAVHIEYWVTHNDVAGTTTQLTAVLEKVPTAGAAATVAELLNLQSYANKKNVLHTFQGIIGTTKDGANPTTLMSGWFLIPKGKQRFGLGDRLILSVTSVTQNFTICGIAIYKEYR